MNNYLLFALGSSVSAVLYGLYLIRLVLSKEEGSDKMKEIASAIQEGAKAYLNRQYRTIFFVAVLVFGVLLFSLGNNTAFGFLVGAFSSALAGYIGMNISVRANVRTTEAAKKGMKEALEVA